MRFTLILFVTFDLRSLIISLVYLQIFLLMAFHWLSTSFCQRGIYLYIYIYNSVYHKLLNLRASGSWTNFEFVLLNWVVFCRSFLFILLLVIVLSLWLMITPLVIFKLFFNFFPVWPVLKLYKFKTYYLPCGQAGFAWSTHHHVASFNNNNV